MLEYSIEVSMEPHPWDNKNEPHFWVIYANRGDQSQQTNEGCGWAKTPALAFEQANKYYEQYIIDMREAEMVSKSCLMSTSGPAKHNHSAHAVMQSEDCRYANGKSLMLSKIEGCIDIPLTKEKDV